MGMFMAMFLRLPRSGPHLIRHGSVAFYFASAADTVVRCGRPTCAGRGSHIHKPKPSCLRPERPMVAQRLRGGGDNRN